MKIVESPFESGQVKISEKPEKYKRIPILGSIIWWFKKPNILWHYEECIKSQIEARGPVPQDAWKTNEQFKVAKHIENILCEDCWLEKFTFHPNDPYYIIGYFEVGDLSEIEALMIIEHHYGFKFNDDYFKSTPTFQQVVDHVIENKTEENEY